MADVRRTVREWAGELDAATGSFLVALSGGGDSLALAWALSHEAPGLHLPVGAVIVDHQLQAGSAERAKIAAELATRWGLAPVITKTVTVGEAGGPEEAARSARYQAFSEALKETGARGVLLAHTKDDQAETVLLGLARGSGPSGLKGMPLRDGMVHRPLLELSRETLRQALRDAGVEWWEDPHNDDDRFTRSRVRTKVLPLLEQELGPGVADSLARTASLFRQDSEALDGLAQRFISERVQAETAGQRSVSVEDLLEQSGCRVFSCVAKHGHGCGRRAAELYPHDPDPGSPYPVAGTVRHRSFRRYPGASGRAHCRESANTQGCERDPSWTLRMQALTSFLWS